MKDQYHDGTDPATISALEYLGCMHGGLPLTVARIDPVTGAIAGDTFSLPNQEPQLAAWLDRYEGKANLYYSLNAAAQGAKAGRAGKLAEADVTHIRGVAVDLDPRKDEPFESERARLLEIATRESRNLFAPPSAIMDSGGGVQMIWLFPEPVPASSGLSEAVKAQARGLQKHFGGDSVFNLDRLLRIPGTTNIPDTKKLARGRQRAPARLLNRSGERHSLASLAAVAQPLEGPSGTAGEREDWQKLGIEYPDILECLGNPDALPEPLQSIAQDIEDRLEDIVRDAAGDRSKQDYRIAVELVRAHRLQDPTAIAQVTFALSPEKLEDLREHDEDAAKRHCGRTVSRALERNWSNPDPHDFFIVETAAPTTKDRQQRGRSRFLSLEELDNLPPPRFLVDRHLPEHGFALLYGEPGSYKSFLAFDMASHVARGLPDWHGDTIDHGGLPGGVIYIAGEGQSGYQTRNRAWELGNNQTPRNVARIWLLPGSVNLMSQKEVAELIEDIRAADFGPISLIVVDTVSRSIPGADENSQQDMTRFVEHCDRIRKEIGCAILGVHHTSKQGEMRGSSVFSGQADAVMKVEKDPKKPGFAILSCKKQKDAPDGWSNTYRLEKEEWEVAGETVSSLYPRRIAQVEREVFRTELAAEWGWALLKVLGDRREARWAEIHENLADVALAQHLTKSRSRDKLLRTLKGYLAPAGIDCRPPSGQIVNISMYKGGKREGWIFRRTDVSELSAKDDETC